MKTSRGVIICRTFWREDWMYGLGLYSYLRRAFTLWPWSVLGVFFVQEILACGRYLSKPCRLYLIFISKFRKTRKFKIWQGKIKFFTVKNQPCLFFCCVLFGLSWHIVATIFYIIYRAVFWENSATNRKFFFFKIWQRLQLSVFDIFEWRFQQDLMPRIDVSTNGGRGSDLKFTTIHLLTKCGFPFQLFKFKHVHFLHNKFQKFH